MNPYSQALVIKQNIELMRSTNRFGVMVWQLNEIWCVCVRASTEYLGRTAKYSIRGFIKV